MEIIKIEDSVKTNDKNASDYYNKLDRYFKSKYPEMEWEMGRVGYARVYDPKTMKIIKSGIPVSSILLLSKDSVKDMMSPNEALTLIAKSNSRAADPRTTIKYVGKSQDGQGDKYVWGIPGGKYVYESVIKNGKVSYSGSSTLSLDSVKDASKLIKIVKKAKDAVSLKKGDWFINNYEARHNDLLKIYKVVDDKLQERNGFSASMLVEEYLFDVWDTGGWGQPKHEPKLKKQGTTTIRGRDLENITVFNSVDEAMKWLNRRMQISKDLKNRRDSLNSIKDAKSVIGSSVKYKTLDSYIKGKVIDVIWSFKGVQLVVEALEGPAKGQHFYKDVEEVKVV